MISSPGSRPTSSHPCINSSRSQVIIRIEESIRELVSQRLNEALDYLREGDTLVVWRLDRLGRSLRGLIDLMNTLHERKVAFKSLIDSIDTSTPTGQFFFHVTGAFLELE